MAATQVRIPCLPEPDPRPTAADHIRDRLSVRAQRLDARFPRALDLESRVLDALGSELRGVASMLSGTHAPEHWREALRGDRALHLDDLCRLATDPAREARSAVIAAHHVLADVVGERPLSIERRHRDRRAGERRR